jgi:hypothetical protein
MVNLQLVPYALSKLLVLSVFFFAQNFVMLLIVSLFEKVPGSFVFHFVTLMGASIAASTLGLIISAVVSSQEKATGLLIMVLLPQIIFSGLIPLEGASKALGFIMVTYWGYDVMKELACSESGIAAVLGVSETRAGVVLGEWIMMGIHFLLYFAITLGILRRQDLK